MLSDKWREREDMLALTWPHLLYGIFVNEVMVVFVECAVQRDTIALEKKVLQCVYARQSE